MATQEIKAIIIDPETNLPTLVKIRGNIKMVFRGRSDTQREDFINNYLKPIHHSLVPNYLLDPDYLELIEEDMNTHPLNLNSFDDMVDNLDACISDQFGETLFALPNTNKVKAIIAKYQVEIYKEGTCWILCLLKDYGREFDNEIHPFLPCVSHNISSSDYE